MINEVWKDRYNNNFSVVINGTTPIITENQPAPFVLKEVKIQTNNSSLRPAVRHYTGSLHFLGSFNNYKQFGNINFLSHEVTVTTCGHVFRGYLLPEIYNIEYTGHTIPFTLNFESILGQLERLIWEEANDIYSVQQILDMIASQTGCTLNIQTSFSESLSNIKIMSENFTNDDGLNENYMKILNWIQTTFGFNILLLGSTLYITSCENDQGTLVYPVEHMDDNETVSVNKLIDTCQVTVNNAPFGDIPTDFTLKGSQFLGNTLPMRIRRGKHYLWSDVGTFWRYYRQIYQYQQGQKVWRFKKYNGYYEVDEFDPSQYMPSGLGTEPVGGAYPIRVAQAPTTKQPNNDVLTSALSPYYEYILLKTTNSIRNADSLMMADLDNYISEPNTFLIFNGLKGMFNCGGGDVNSWSRGWNTNYDADNGINSSSGITYSSNMNLGMVPLAHVINWDAPFNFWTMRVVVTFTPNGGTPMIWDFINKSWGSSFSGGIVPMTKGGGGGNREFEWYTPADNFLSAPLLEDGSFANFGDVSFEACMWCRLPSTMGRLQIGIGFDGNTITNILLDMQSFTINRVVQRGLEQQVNEDASLTDLVYSNTNQSETDENETFYIYSYNETHKNFGKGLLMVNSDSYITNLTYPYGQDQPEWNYIACMTQLFSKGTVYNDVIKINDLNKNYSDRFTVGYNINVTTGNVEISTFKPISYTLNQVS